MPMSRNMHLVDRLVRIVLGLGLGYICIMDQTILDDVVFNSVLAVLAVINVVSGIVGYCPVYQVAGISGCRKSVG